MERTLAEKVAVITGAGKRDGIGFAIGSKLASLGADVVLCDLSAQMDEMQELIDEIKGAFSVGAVALELDVTNTESVASMAEELESRFQTVDVLVNNAGAVFGVPSAVHQYQEDAWLRTIDVNLHGTFRVSKAVLPLMTRRGASIVNIASKAGKSPPLLNGAYAVAKAGVIMLTKVMAKELAPQGIRVNAVCPAIIMTGLQRWRLQLEAKVLGCTVEDRQQAWCREIPMGYIGRPEEVADIVAFLSSEEASYITGQAINVCGGLLMEL